MKKNTLFTCILLFSLQITPKAQISVGINSGTENLIGFQAGYELNNHLEAGLKYNPASQILSSQGVAGYIGPYCKYNFSDVSTDNTDNFYSFFVKATIGTIKPPSNSYYEEIGNFGNITRKDINYKSTFGGALGGGAEIGRGRLKFIAELGIGKMPNIFKSINSTDPYSTTIIEANTSKAFTTSYYMNTGLVYRIRF